MVKINADQYNVYITVKRKIAGTIQLAGEVTATTNSWLGCKHR